MAHTRRMHRESPPDGRYAIVRDDQTREAGPIFADRGEALTHARHSSEAGRAVTHDFAALAFYVGGRARWEHHGTWTVHGGDVLIVPPGAVHRVLEADAPQVWRAGFCVPCVAAQLPPVVLRPIDRVRAGASPLVRITGSRVGFLESLFQELAAARAPHVRLSLLTLMLHEIDAAGQWALVRGREDGSLVGRALDLIDRNCLRPLTLGEIAATLGRTPAHVTTTVRRATGRSVGEWIVAGRMAEARRRLLHSTERIDVIAERVGYADPTHFIRMFKRVHGLTPAGWRAQQVPAPFVDAPPEPLAAARARA